MCGIWGIVGKKQCSNEEIYQMIKDLFVLSESRGKEASGIAYLYNDKTMCYKKPLPASKIIRLAEFQNLLKEWIYKSTEDIAVIGHSRLVTNGSEKNNENNQPISYGNVTTVHNGIIVNVDELWNSNAQLNRECDVDTEVFVKICEDYYRNGTGAQESIKKTFRQICGMTSTISIFSDSKKLIAATNNGSLYCWKSQRKGIVLFASERYMFYRLYKINKFVKTNFNVDFIIQLNREKSMEVDLNKKTISKISLPKGIIKFNSKDWSESNMDIYNSKFAKYDIDIEPIRKIKRCTKCVLPETMPFIQFDNKGVCNYCRSYKKMEYLGLEAMKKRIDEIKEKNRKKEYNSIVSFSGGRDSSYGLHYFVKNLELNPVCYNYDWGMVTDLARRNQSRMCAALGVELITVSADIRKKRQNIRKNILAWMKNPDMGLVPLFMAGDKAFYYYANVMKKRFGLDCILLASNPFETTYFKSGFCGVMPAVLQKKENGLEVEQLGMGATVKMASHYAKEYLTNWSYINSSVFDTASAMASYYMIPHDYFRLYNYIPWDEEEINNVLLNEYDWEKADDTESTWRIGDGTAPFYNYIYYLIGGFTENDTLRSNQIREGKLDRRRALELIYLDNQPRWNSLKWYFDTIGLDMGMVLDRVNCMQRLYKL